MRSNIKKRILKEADFIIESRNTIRQAAEYFRTSKSTIHKDISERLQKIDRLKHEKIEAIMQEHTELRHIKGGEATRKKYKCIAKKSAK